MSHQIATPKQYWNAMLEIEIVQDLSGAWAVRYRVDHPNNTEGWTEPTLIATDQLGMALQAMGNNINKIVDDAQAVPRHNTAVTDGHEGAYAEI